MPSLRGTPANPDHSGGPTRPAGSSWRLPRRISPAARARRTWLVDLLCAALLAGVALTITAGLGVVVFLAVPVLLIGAISLLVERGFARARRRHRSGRHAKAVGRRLG